MAKRNESIRRKWRKHRVIWRNRKRQSCGGSEAWRKSMAYGAWRQHHNAKSRRHGVGIAISVATTAYGENIISIMAAAWRQSSGI